MVKLKYRRLGTLFKRVQTEIRRFIVLDRYGAHLRENKVLERMSLLKHHDHMQKLSDDKKVIPSLGSCH